MPTPRVYAHPGWNPFVAVPDALRDPDVSVLYLTDRAPDAEAEGGYGQERSRSVAFGQAIVELGDLSWDELIAESRTEDRTRAVPLALGPVSESARFGDTPPSLVLTEAQLASSGQDSPEHAATERLFLTELSARLARSPTKQVFLYVHGYNNTFEEAVLTTGELWHFLGREGVPICYTWPAGVGVFRAYQYTLASTDFTIFHFKEALRLIASCPDVERINILAHSRGTAVTMDGLRELHIELRGSGSTREALKLGTVVLAAADLDFDVVVARNTTERVGQAVERMALYVSREDKALGFASWLFGGALRLGRLDGSIMTSDEINALRHHASLQVVDAQVRRRGAFGHGYFHQNPAVSSDLVLLLRYGLAPGEAHGRPLGVADSGFWVVTDDYPGREWVPPPLSAVVAPRSTPGPQAGEMWPVDGGE